MVNVDRQAAPSMQELIYAIDRVRESLTIEQGIVADMLGVTRRSYNQWRNRKAVPNQSRQQHMVKVLSILMDWRDMYAWAKSEGDKILDQERARLRKGREEISEL